MIQMVVQDIQIKMLIFSLLDKFYISPSLVFVKILLDDGQNAELSDFFPHAWQLKNA